jgi:DNA repair exonuclease SbcCD ATPase subunit
MRIEEINLRGFMSHADSSLSLPSTGAVVITGQNGSGKSSFVEAVSYAVYGKTLRGTDPWREGEKGSLEVTTERFDVRRTTTAKGTKKLFWGPRSRDTAEFTQYDTQTKAKAAFEASLPMDFDLWRRTHVFSSADAANFSMASDHERKRFVEAVLGVSKFDPALERSRHDMKLARQELAAASSAIAGLNAHIAQAQRALTALRESEPLWEPVPAPVAPSLTAEAVTTQDVEDAAMEVQDLAEAVEVQQREAQRKPTPAEISQGVYQADAELRRLKTFAKNRAGGECQACGATYAIAEGAQAAHDLEQAQVAYDNAVAFQEEWETVENHRSAQARDKLGNLNAALDAARRAQQNLQILRDRWRQFETQQEQHAQLVQTRRQHYDVQHDQWRVRCARIEEEIGEYEDRLLDAEGRHAEASAEHSVLDQVERVLGMSGVRAAIMSEALTAIEDLANSWLGIMATDIHVKLTGTSFTKDGKHSDRIGLEVVNAGGGHGYKGASGGERRRVDAAILLALTQVASGACGVEPGTLWLDEVFDALDVEEGVPAVGAAIAEVAKTRPVVVITHSEALAASVPGADRFSVTHGVIKKL